MVQGVRQILENSTKIEVTFHPRGPLPSKHLSLRAISLGIS